MTPVWDLHAGLALKRSNRVGRDGKGGARSSARRRSRDFFHLGSRRVVGHAPTNALRATDVTQLLEGRLR
jgi:hypothetical protein